ncbi:GNAT family N-acetyltransferase [Mangrovimonas sp. YM274]|uniref:GNAT family N-acetyltransferase n=1 Tax=Mangrovimonas sp. YM274 TaxID=3070660 RepID=UPI0027DBE8AD|nr:GNAT family N-acetyltransferase [Mangrovimonas sp. YM274]WMI67939.1 GNAT family N-acetyltransferase [Mangrovimonas sp. YM274]
MELLDYTDKVDLFFEKLPRDWQDAIEPFWEDIQETTKLYVITNNNQIMVGGLVFKQCPPDLLYYKRGAENWFTKGYLYLGFIYTMEAFRGQKLGSEWLRLIRESYPQNGFWLAIEDETLHDFYVKSGFEKSDNITTPYGETEIIYSCPPLSLEFGKIDTVSST